MIFDLTESIIKTNQLWNNYLY